MPAVRTVSRLARLGAAAGGLVLLAGCGTAPSLRTVPANATGATFLLVANADAVVGTDEDPPLSPAGEARAERLAQALADAPLVAIYTDEFRRTQQTAAPVAAQHPRAERLRYFSRGPAQDSARQWRSAYDRDTVLVVAQPDTLAPLADALCGCTVRPMRAGQVDRLLRIHLPAHAAAQVQDMRYGGPAP